MTEESRKLISEIAARLESVRNNRDFNAMATTLLSDIAEMSDSRMNFRPVLERMFTFLNTTENNEPLENPYDTRWTSPAFQTMAPIARAQADLAVLIQILRAQVFVYTATGTNLDDLGRDYSFPRFVATQAIRRGITLNQQMEPADFSAGSRFMTRSGFEPLIFIIDSTEGGNVFFRCESYGTVGNTYYGDLSPASPLNGIGRATITDDTGAYRPGQNHETDEQYRRRFLRFLRRVAFGGNVADYQRFVQAIDGVADLVVFPCWRSIETTKISIVSAGIEPVSDEFIEYVNNKVDPIVRGGAGFGTAPIGHRVTVSTPQWLDINVFVPVVLTHDLQLGQVQTRLNELLREYIDIESRQAVLDEWERTYYANQGISNAWFDAGCPEWFPSLSESIRQFIQARVLMALAVNLPTVNLVGIDLLLREVLNSYQYHTFTTVLHPQTIGVRLLETRLVSAVDFANITINGRPDPNGLVIQHNQEVQYIPRLNTVEIHPVDYIAPQVPIDPAQTIQKTYLTGFDKPVTQLSEVT